MRTKTTLPLLLTAAFVCAGAAMAQDGAYPDTATTRSLAARPFVATTAPSSPPVYDQSGRLAVAQSTGAPDRPVQPFQGVCVVAHGACPAATAGPGLFCTCPVQGIGQETGLSR